MRRAVAVACLTALSCARPAWAEDAALSEARERFGRGLELYRGGLHDAALAEFERAYEIAPTFQVLFNIGQIYAELGRLADAVQTFERYLAEGGARVPASSRATVEAELERLGGLVGRVLVTVLHPEAASVYVDDLQVGAAPLESPLVVASGRHVVEVRSEGYLTFRREVTVASGTTVGVEVRLVQPLAAPAPVAGPPEPAPEPAAAPGTVLLTTSVPAARVSLDGAAVGLTPLAGAFPASAGSHVLLVERAGYFPERAEVEVRSGEVARVEVALRRLDRLRASEGGPLELGVTEPGAHFRVDGQPYQGEMLPAGPHVLEARRRGFEPWAETFEIVPGTTTRLEVRLRPTETHRRRYERRARGLRAGAGLTLAMAILAVGSATGLFIWNAVVELENFDERLWVATQLLLARDERDEGVTQGGLDERWEELRDARARYMRLCWLSAGLWIVGGLSAAVSTAFFVVGPPPSRYRRLAVVPAPGSLSVAWAWR